MKKLLLILLCVPLIGFGQEKKISNCLGDCVNGYGELTVGYDGVCGGFFYKGQFKNGKRDGRGMISHRDGGDYIGYFRENKMSGKGAYITFPYINDEQYLGDVYYGDWENDLKNGEGILIGKHFSFKGSYPYDFATYSGEFKNDKKHGKGTIIFKYLTEDIDDIILYEGQFKDDKMHGKGLMIYESGKILDGFWENNKFIGE
jgi:hypothetical protein